MDRFKHRKVKRQLRHGRVRSKISGEADRPRLAVFRSDKHIYAQIIDDTKGTTIASASDLAIEKGKKSERATEVGRLIAESAKKAGVAAVRFDRGGFKYHGRIKALAEGAREAGLQF